MLYYSLFPSKFRVFNTFGSLMFLNKNALSTVLMQTMTSLLCIIIGSHTNETFLDPYWSKITMAQIPGLSFVNSSLCGPMHSNKNV